MKFRAQRVMCVYASGKRVAELLLRLKNARGRPRPTALNDRSTSPFASSTFRCFSVAILEIRSSSEMSESETAPRSLRVRRICFLADEKPASRPPASTSLTGTMDYRKALRYHIPIRLQNREFEASFAEAEIIRDGRRRRRHGTDQGVRGLSFLFRT